MKRSPTRGGCRTGSTLFAVTWIALTGGPAAASPISTSARPTRLVSGMLSTPSQLSPDVIARRFVASRADLLAGAPAAALVTGPARHLPDGALVEFGQRYRGLPVVGSSAAVRTDALGRVRWARSSLRAIPDDLSTAPRIEVSAALTAAGVATSDAATRSRARSELVVWALSESAAPRLAWRLRLPTDRRRLERWEVVIDAVTGAELGRRNRVLRAARHRARIYPDNPVATPDLVEVTLDRLPAGATRLTDPDLTATSCRDRDECEVIFETAWHVCTLEQAAEAGPAGDFLSIVMSSDPLDPLDAFAELSVYAHAARAYAFFRTLTADPFFTVTGGPITAVANALAEGQPCDDGRPQEGDELVPFDNAIFLPADETDGAGPQMWFGQGYLADFGIDGDVVYHELGHGLVTTLAPDLGWTLPHPHGIDVTPGGLVEGLPDYLAAALSESSRIGEYVDATSPVGPVIDRDLANQRRCPIDLTGESHDDSLIVSGALWEIRGGLAEEQRATFDRAVVTAIDALGADGNFETFGHALRAEVETALGAPAAAAAAAVLASRGVDDCDDMVRELGPDDLHRHLVAGAFVGLDFAGGAPVQFRIVLDHEAAGLKVRASGVSWGGDTAIISPFNLAIKPGAAPIEWPDGVLEAGIREETILGELDLPPDGVLEKVVRGPFPAGVYHVQVTCPEGTLTELVDIGVAPTDDVTPLPPSGADAGPGAGPDDGGDDSESGGCGCQTDGRGGGAAGLGILFAAALATRRRRIRREARRLRDGRSTGGHIR
jgi:MYXO-CTERM domain-containing protein